MKRETKHSLTRKLVVVVLIGTATAMLIQVALSAYRQQKIIIEEESLHYRDAFVDFVSVIDSRTRTALALATSVAEQESVKAAFAERDRPELTRLTMPIFLALEPRIDITQFQFHTPDARSFLRLHELDAYGDSLEAFRRSLVEGNDSKTSVRVRE